MIEIYIDKTDLKNATFFAMNEIQKRSEMFRGAIRTARRASIAPIKTELDSLFSHHSGRHPERDTTRSSDHFEIDMFPNINMGRGQGDAIYGITIRAKDDVGAILMEGARPHDIGPIMKHTRLYFEFTDTEDIFIGPPGRSLDQITKKTNTHPGHKSYLEDMTEIVQEIYMQKVAGVRAVSGGDYGKDEGFFFEDMEEA